MPSMRIVGSPTPTGTDWPSLPQVPMPSSSSRSWPTRADAREHVGAVADQRRALHRRGDPAVLDQVGLAGREDELAAGDVDLAAAERHRVEPALDRADDVLGVVLAGQHERVGHARHRRMREALAAAVAGGRHPHQPGVEPVLQVAAEDAVLDQHGAAGRRALVVHVERAAPVRDGAVVDHGHQLGGDLLADAPGEGRHALAVEVALEAVTDRLVQQDAGPARPEHDGHRAGRRVDRAQLDDRLARGLGREAGPALLLEEEVEGHAAAAAVRADLALAVVLGDAR